MADWKAGRDEVIEDVTPAPSSTKMTVESWATAKGFLPQFFAGKDGAAGADGRATFGTGRKPNQKFWQFAAARGLKGWVEGAEVTEADFDAAIVAACNVSLR